ncbi:MAG: GAF domain-containing protein [Deltaproteobacteria bacterium]|nr:MAG: GAF domain-containing protein [Deltaproteobacteria bacterium]
MLSLPEYDVQELISLGARSTVYRGRRRSDQTPVVLKTRTSESLTPRDVARIRFAFQLSQSLAIEGVCTPYELLDDEQRPVIVMEDIGGVALSHLLREGPLEPGLALQLALGITTILGELHQHFVIHKDIKPSNVIVEQEEGRIQIIDFELASQLSRETPELKNISLLEGTLGYIAPEQTGRMNRSVDQRADLYSLGATMYHMFVGELPFSQTNPMSLVHAHIATLPTPPHRVNPNVPIQVSKVILKLMAKTPEDRYQSALGLQRDLVECLEQYLQTGSISLFQLDNHEYSHHLQVSQRLYGREEEIQQLMEAFEQAKNGQSPILLVGGYSGVGKTALVREVHKPIVGARGRFVSGKFDRFQNAPYSGLVQGLTQLLQSILTESEESIQQWRDTILEELGDLGQLMVDLIPELELLVGTQKPVPPLSSLETKNRFNRLFVNFFKAFVKPESPLVFFLDDLQWADSASIQMIRLLLQESDLNHVLMIGAYRDNEVSTAHPLARMMEDMSHEHAPLTTLRLQPLSREDVAQLVASSLFQSVDEVALLVEEVYAKTNGNPFFVERLLRSMFKDELLWLNADTHRWEWDLSKIKGLESSENVTELMAQQIQRLPQSTQTLMQQAACMGNTFTLSLLSHLTQKAEAEIAEQLWPSLRDELVLPVGEEYRYVGFSYPVGSNESWSQDAVYRFSHDRVQEGAYELLSEEGRANTHLRIGRMLLSQHNLQEQPTLLFDVVNNLNLGRSLVTSPNDREELARLNHRAGMRAMEASAWQSAHNYMLVATELLPETIWEDNHKLAYLLHSSLLQTAAASGETERWQQQESLLLERCKAQDEQVLVHKFRIQRLIMNAANDEAVAACIDALKLFGFEEPTDSEGWNPLIGAESSQIGQHLEGRSVSDLLEAPVMTDPQVLQEMDLLLGLAPVSMIKAELFAYTVSRMARLSMTYGHCDASPSGYIYYAAFLSALQQYEAADAYGQLALALNPRFGGPSKRAPIDHMYGAFVQHWQHPISEVQTHLQRAVTEGAEHGIFNSAGWATLNITPFMLEAGDELPNTLQVAEEYAELAQHVIRYNDIRYFQLAMVHIVCDLMGNTRRKDALDAQGLSVEELDKPENLGHYLAALGYVYTHRLSVAIILRKFDEASTLLPNALSTTAIIPQGLAFAAVRFYENLLLAETFHTLSKEEQEAAQATMQTNLAMYEVWSVGAPSNYKAKLELLKASYMVLEETNDPSAVMRQFDQAIDLAQTDNLRHVQALALEGAARYCLERQQNRMARGYLIDAHLTYMRWGALAKETALEEEFPSLRAQSSSRMAHTLTAVGTLSSTHSVGTTAPGHLDLLSIQKASQAIASEIVLADLLGTLMQVLSENAGASRSVLLLRENEGWFVEAEWNHDKDPQVQQSTPTEKANLPHSIVRYTTRSHKRVVLGNAVEDERFGNDLYVQQVRPLSVLCMPIRNQNKVIGLLYMENAWAAQVFTPERCSVLDILGAQAAISLENALLYNKLEAKVTARTEELQQTLEQLEQRHVALQNAQVQLVQSEKMASLGGMVAGVAHEFNNHSNYTKSSLQMLDAKLHDFQDLLLEITTDDNPSIVNLFKEKFDPLFRSVSRALDGVENISGIVQDLRTFSRLDEEKYKAADILAGLQSTLTLVRPNTQEDLEIELDIKANPRLLCWSAHLNQAFMNIMLNASQAVADRKAQDPSFGRGHLWIRFYLRDERWLVIEFQDNGVGMSDEVRRRICEPFFTSRPAGTGLGMSVTHSVMQKHNGRIEVRSTPGHGSTISLLLPLTESVQQP